MTLALQYCKYMYCLIVPIKPKKKQKVEKTKNKIIHKCPHCDYSSDRKSIMKVHIRVHTGERPFKCDQCEYSSIERTSLTRHKRTHTGQNFEMSNCYIVVSIRVYLFRRTTIQMRSM